MPPWATGKRLRIKIQAAPRSFSRSSGGFAAMGGTDEAADLPAQAARHCKQALPCRDLVRATCRTATRNVRSLRGQDRPVARKLVARHMRPLRRQPGACRVERISSQYRGIASAWVAEPHAGTHRAAIIPVFGDRSRRLLDLRTEQADASDAAHAEIFHFEVILEAMAGTLPPDAGLFDPAEGCRFRGHASGVDTDHAIFQGLGHTPDTLQV